MLVVRVGTGLGSKSWGLLCLQKVWGPCWAGYAVCWSGLGFSLYGELVGSAILAAGMGIGRAGLLY